MSIGRDLRSVDVAGGDDVLFVHDRKLERTCDVHATVGAVQQCTRAMSATLPRIQPSYAPQPAGVAWPTTQWPRGAHYRQLELEAVVDEAFSMDDLAVTNAVVIVQGGRVLVERYAGVKEFFDRPTEPVTADSTLLSWSMAKSMLHMIIGTLVDEGRLDVDGYAAVPEWADDNDPRHVIRLRDLLAMRDGLAFVEVYEIGATSHVIEMLFGEGKSDMAGYTARLPLAHAPDTVFNYSSGTTNVLSRIVADQVGYGDVYRKYLETRLFGPLGMTSAEATFDATGVFVASSYVHATALDFAKFGLLYLRGGEWDGTQLLSRAWADTAQVPLSVDEEDGSFYSWQWWVTGDRYGTYWASGYEGQMIAIAPALDALVLRFGHTPAEHYPDLAAWRSRVLDVLASS
jgi:CubicO group peptidase (beta-lactamase class C family)